MKLCPRGVWRRCCSRRSWRSLFLTVIFVHIVAFLLVVSNLGSIWRYEDDFMFDTDFDNTLPCENVHVALVCVDWRDVRETMELLNTLLRYRTHDLTVHIIANHQAQHIINTISETWQLPGVTVHTYKRLVHNNRTEELTRVQQLLNLHNVLPQAVLKVLVLDTRVRFISNIIKYWTNFRDLHRDTLLAVSGDNLTLTDAWWGVTFVDLYKIRSRILKGRDWPRPVTWSDVRRLLLDGGGYISPVGYHWAQPLDLHTFAVPNTTQPLAIVWPRDMTRIRNEVFRIPFATNARTMGDVLTIIERVQGSDPHVFRTPIRTYCVTPRPDHVTYVHDKCSKFRAATTLQYVTHLYFINGGAAYDKYQYDVVKERIGGDYDTTLLTMFTISRLSHFKLMVRNWEGPIVAVVYGSPREVRELHEEVMASSDESRLRDVTYHIVYRNGELVPVNYLRNIARNETATAFTFYDDVDLIPVPGLYTSLKDHLRIEDEKHQLNNTVFIVPAFASSKPLTDEEFPSNKPELVERIDQDLVAPWGQKGGWKFGHRNTNYTRWFLDSESYQVNYQHLWEPYIIVPTTSKAQYVESLTERIRNKIAYTLALYVEGFKFRILPDVFVIHQSHAMTNNWRDMRYDMKLYKECCYMLYAEYVLDIQLHHPGVIMPNDTMFELQLGTALDETKLDW